MTENVEILFENISYKDLDTLLLILLSNSNEILGIELQGDNFVISNHNVLLDKLNLIKEKVKSGHSLIISCDKISIGDSVLKGIFIRLYTYEDSKYDIELSFDMDISNIYNQTHIEKLNNNLFNLCKDIDVTNIIFGCEPASDEDTRYFTNNRFGPMFLQSC